MSCEAITARFLSPGFPHPLLEFEDYENICILHVMDYKNNEQGKFVTPVAPRSITALHG